MTEYETVLRTPELGPGDLAAVQAHGRPIAVANVGQTYYAVDAMCPVDGTNLGREGRLDGEVLICPHDEARFDVRTGERVDPRTVTGAESHALRAHEIRVEGNEVRVGPARAVDGSRA